MSITLGSRLSRAARNFAVTVGLLGCAGLSSADVPDAVFFYDRDNPKLDVWFGTLSVTGLPGFSEDFLQLSELIPNDLILAIQGDFTADLRVRNNLPGVWLNPGQLGFEWVLQGNPPNPPPAIVFNAQQNLIDAYSARAFSLFGTGTLDLTVSLFIGEHSYVLLSQNTMEVAPIYVGDSDNPVLFGGLGQDVTIQNDAVGLVRYYEQNAIWTPRLVTPVTEPSTLALFSIALVSFALVRRRLFSPGSSRATRRNAGTEARLL